MEPAQVPLAKTPAALVANFHVTTRILSAYCHFVNILCSEVASPRKMTKPQRKWQPFCKEFCGRLRRPQNSPFFPHALRTGDESRSTPPANSTQPPFLRIVLN